VWSKIVGVWLMSLELAPIHRAVLEETYKKKKQQLLFRAEQYKLNS